MYVPSYLSRIVGHWVRTAVRLIDCSRESYRYPAIPHMNIDSFATISMHHCGIILTSQHYTPEHPDRRAITRDTNPMCLVQGY